jgi:hypothetical protein
MSCPGHSEGSSQAIDDNNSPHPQWSHNKDSRYSTYPSAYITERWDGTIERFGNTGRLFLHRSTPTLTLGDTRKRKIAFGIVVFDHCTFMLLGGHDRHEDFRLSH